MKQIIGQLKSIKAIVIVLCICFITDAKGQTPPACPSSPDVYWYTSANAVTGMNTAMIGYQQGLTPDYLMASIYADGSGGESLYVYDPVISSACSTVSTGSIASTPDITIGNKTASSTQFYIATAYVDGSGDARIDFYLLSDDGVNPISVSLPLTNHYIISAGTYDVHNVHIDAIADFGNTGTTGFPFCGKFAVTWDDYTNGGSQPDVYVALGDFNTQSVGTARKVTVPGSSIYGYAPDVAGIRRSGFAGPTTIRNVALVTYLDETGTILRYREYDLTGGSAIAANTDIDDGTNSSAIYPPRIDADDSHFSNNSGSNANYKIVAQATDNSSTKNEVRTYDNISVGNTPTYWTSSNVVDFSTVTGYGSYSPPYENYAPCVALGPLDYLVTHEIEYTTNSDILFMEPINIGTYNALSAGVYYWVNTATSPPGSANTTTCAYANSVSTPPNNPGVQSLLAWAQEDAGPAYKIYYKLTGSSYAFKPAEPAQSVRKQDGWFLYPNPTTGVVTINNRAAPGDFSTYLLREVTGRVVTEGPLAAGTQQVDIGALENGTYMITVFRNGLACGTELVMKN